MIRLNSPWAAATSSANMQKTSRLRKWATAAGGSPRSRMPWAIRASCPATLMVIASRVTPGCSFSGSLKTQPSMSRFSGSARSSSAKPWTFSTVPVKLVWMIEPVEVADDQQRRVLQAPRGRAGAGRRRRRGPCACPCTPSRSSPASRRRPSPCRRRALVDAPLEGEELAPSGRPRRAWDGRPARRGRGSAAGQAERSVSWTFFHLAMKVEASIVGGSHEVRGIHRYPPTIPHQAAGHVLRLAIRRGRSARLDHRHDAGFDRLGQGGPGIDDGGQVGGHSRGTVGQGKGTVGAAGRNSFLSCTLWISDGGIIIRVSGVRIPPPLLASVPASFR